ncbi:MAG: DUF4430 domain-containing protein [Ruminococcus sp.]|nr:DUF4430 domain-containing protein [Ruminococcus sp.]
MRKTMKNALISVLGASIIVSALPLCAYADADDTDNQYSVSVRVEGISECFCYDTVKIESETELTAADILRELDAQYDDLEITWTISDYGDYISAVNGETAGCFGAWDGWMYCVNGVSLSVGVGNYTIADGDEIVLYYIYQSSDVTPQYPEYDYDSSTGILTFTSMDTVGYDDSWNAITERQAVEGMTVTLSNADFTYELVTDENGAVNLSDAGIDAEEYYLSYSKATEDGAPLVLRPEPDLTFDVEYAYSIGDLNGDNVVDAVDASLILSIYAKTAVGDYTASAIEKGAANVNYDAAVDAVDASLTLAYFAYSQTGGEASFEEYLSE